MFDIYSHFFIVLFEIKNLNPGNWQWSKKKYLFGENKIIDTFKKEKENEQTFLDKIIRDVCKI